MSEICTLFSDKPLPGTSEFCILILNIQDQIAEKIRTDAEKVWTAVDFADIGVRDAIDKALQRLTASDDLEKVARGLYQTPSYNSPYFLRQL